MGGPNADRVAYSNPNFSQLFLVERVTTYQMWERALPAMSQLTIQACANSYEAPNGPLPQGTFSSHFSDGGRLTSEARDFRMRGGQYWLAWNEARDTLIGLAKTKPEDGSPKDFNLSDVMVHPDLQRKGCGSMLAHAALKHSGYGDRRLITSNFVINTEMGPIYEDMGMVPLGEMQPQIYKNGSVLTSQRYVSKEGLTVASIVQKLEERYGYLAQATNPPESA